MNPYEKHFKKLRNQNGHSVAKPKTNSKKKAPVNQKGKNGLIAACTLGFALALYGTLYPEMIIDVFKAYEVGVFSNGLAADQEVSSSSKDSGAAKATSSTSNKKSGKKSKADEFVYKDPSYIKGLMAKEKELDEREEQITKLEKKLQQQRDELNQKLKELDEARREIASRLDSRVKEDEENIMKLVGIYSNMKPQNAAYLLMQLDEDLAVSVLKKMKKREAGSILNFVEPKKAKTLSEKYSGY